MWTNIAGWDVRDHCNNNSLSRWRNWELARLKDLTHTHVAFRGRAQLFWQCPKCLTTKICSPQNNRTYTLDLYCKGSIIIPFHRFKTWDSEKINWHLWELMGKVGLTLIPSAQEAESVPSSALPALQLKGHRNIPSISPLHLYRRMYLVKGGNCSLITSFST